MTNNGTVDANASAGLSLNTYHKVNNGAFKSSNGGILTVNIDISGAGNWVADNGKIQLNKDVDVTTTGNISITNSGEIELNSATMSGSDLTIDSTGITDIDSSVSLSGDLSFAMTDETLWEWGSSAVLKMTGGAGAPIGDWGNWASLEVGGFDFGTDPVNHVGDPQGFSNNFNLPKLVIKPDAHVFLSDLIDNGNRNGPFGSAEALYVDTLTFEATSGLLNLNGLHLYYKTLVGNIGQIIDVLIGEHPPIIERISPEIGQISGGDEMTITGKYFQAGATVTIGGNPATDVSVDSETQITARIPTGELGIADVVVTNPDGGASTLLKGFTYIPMYGDVSGNGTVSAYDAALILQFTVGLISEFPVQQLLSPEQNITPRNYTVSIPKQSAKTGSKIQVPIVIDDATGLFAGGISIKYDASVLKAVNVLPTEMLNGSYWEANVSLPSEIRFAFAKTELMQGSGSLLTIEFQILPGAEGKSSPLLFSSINLSNSLSVEKIDGLVNVIPTRTTLLPNYPNPFNPETWIPYKLSQEASVAIYIYSSNGQLVRKLDLGYQSAGVYVSKAQAAHWDGKDSLGQKVASGVYYYTLQVREAIPNTGAGEFRATRKMVIFK
jgi:hypothetical protein